MQEQPRGWKATHFQFGAGFVDVDHMEEQKADDSPYGHDVIDYGCYRATVDFELLDQQ